MSDNITLPRELAEKALEALEHFKLVFGGFSEEVKALRTALAAEQPKHDLMKWAKDAGSSPEDLERFATYTIATRDMEIATLREENEALRRDAEQPKPEPVVWWDVNKPLDYLTRCENGTTFHNQVIMPRHAVAWAYTNSPENIEALRRDAFRKGFYAGFAATGEGWNGEYPFQNKNRPIAGDPSVEAAIDAAMQEGT